MKTLLSEFVRSKRRINGLNQREFAAKVGIDASLLSRIEAGKTKKPTPETLEALARGLNVPYVSLQFPVGDLNNPQTTTASTLRVGFIHEISSAPLVAFTLESPGLEPEFAFTSYPKNIHRRLAEPFWHSAGSKQEVLGSPVGYTDEKLLNSLLRDDMDIALLSNKISRDYGNGGVVMLLASIGSWWNPSSKIIESADLVVRTQHLSKLADQLLPFLRQVHHYCLETQKIMGLEPDEALRLRKLEPIACYLNKPPSEVSSWLEYAKFDFLLHPKYVSFLS